MLLRARPGAAAVLVTLLALLLAAHAPGVASAHPFGPGPPPTALLEADGSTVTVAWTAPEDDVAALAEDLGIVEEGTSEAFLWSVGPDPLDGAERRAASADPRLAGAIEGGIVVRQDDRACGPRIEVAADAFADGVTATFDCPQPVDVVEVEITLLHDLEPGYRTVGLVGGDGPEVVAVFTDAAPVHAIDLLEGQARSGLEALAAWSPPGGSWVEDRLVGLADVDPGGVAALVAVASAVAVGAAHALAPGHAKVAAGAYVAGGGGRPRHALALGAVVAGMHVATTLVLAATLVALPWSPHLGAAAGGLLTLAAGALLLAVGAGMLRRRRGPPSADAAGPRGGRDTGHGHRHHAGTHTPLSWRGIATVGAAGGLLPSPSALLVLATTWLAGRPGLGLALVAGFAVGLAATIALVGLAAGRGRALLEASAKPTLGRLASSVPLLAGLLVLAGGAWLTASGAFQLLA